LKDIKCEPSFFPNYTIRANFDKQAVQNWLLAIKKGTVNKNKGFFPNRLFE
jgi:hypothetical protein